MRFSYVLIMLLFAGVCQADDCKKCKPEAVKQTDSNGSFYIPVPKRTLVIDPKDPKGYRIVVEYVKPPNTGAAQSEGVKSKEGERKPEPVKPTPEPAKPAKVGLVRKVGRAVFGKRCK